MDYLRSRLFQWAGDACTFKGDAYIELAYSPSNLNGFLRQAVLNSEDGKTIYDLAYYWPQYTLIISSVDHDMIFTISKSIGHAGTHLGWALVKDTAVARKMVKFIELNTIGVSLVSQIRAAKILKVSSDSYEHPIPGNLGKLFDFGRHVLDDRWKKLRKAVKALGIFRLPEFPSKTCKFTDERAKSLPGM